jgi:conjugative relaxase-like TrwC/TraI family protein
MEVLEDMISLQTLKGSGKEAKNYLQQGQEVERYYSDKTLQSEIERGVYFGGHGLGLHGRVVGIELENILDGRKETGENLYERGRAGRRVGFDITFSPDKSVSLLWARLDEPNRRKIEDALRHSVEETLGYTQKHILDTCVRRGPGGIVKEAPQDLTFALFLHGSSRERDPQLHVHSILMNFAQREDGSYGAIEAKALFEKQVEIRRIFNLSFAHKLKSELGIEIELHPDGVRVKDISRELCDEYSKRAKQIDAKLEKLGVSRNDGGKTSVISSREKKDLSIADRDLIPLWQKEFDERSFTEEKGKSLLGGERAASLSVEEEKKRIDACFKALGENTRNLTETQLRALVAHHFTGVLGVGELESKIELLKKDERLLTREFEKIGNRYTTKEAVELSKRALELGIELGNRTGHTVKEEISESILERYVKEGMSEEQRGASRSLFKSQDLIVLIGAAGTGKSYSLRAAREVFEESGYTVRGLGPTGKASSNLEEASEIKSVTVDKFLCDKNKGKDHFDEKTIVIVDEAAMIGNDKTRKLLEAVQESGAKIILVGDEKQLTPLESGRPFEQIRDALGAFEIREVRRQKEEWQKEASKHIRADKIREAFILYEDQGRMKHSSTWEQIRASVVEDWANDRKANKDISQLVLCSTREKVDELNLSLREKLISEGQLLNSSKDRETKISIVKRDGTLEEKHFAPGERIYFTRNDKTVGVKNGTLGTIESITRVKRGVFEFQVRIDEKNGPRKVTFRSDTYKNIDYGYATTVHKSQGDTIDRTYIVAEKMMDKNAAYVAFTRHRYEAKLYVATELIHGYVREFQEEKKTEKKVKLHLDKLDSNIKEQSKRNQNELDKEIDKSKDIEENQNLSHNTSHTSTTSHKPHLSISENTHSLTESLSQSESKSETKSEPQSNHLDFINKVQAAIESKMTDKWRENETGKERENERIDEKNISKTYPYLFGKIPERNKTNDKTRENNSLHNTDIDTNQNHNNNQSQIENKISSHNVQDNESIESKERVVYVTHKSHNAAQNLGSYNRDEVTLALFAIATEPKGVSHKFASYDGKIEEFQKEAARILRSQVYDKESLLKLSQTVQSMEIGHHPVLTKKESDAHSIKVQDSFKDRDKGLAVGRELETLYVTTKQIQSLEKILTTKFHTERIEALKTLSLLPPVVGNEYGKSKDPWHINRDACDMLRTIGERPSLNEGQRERDKQEGIETLKSWAKTKIETSVSNGKDLSLPHKDNFIAIVQERSERALHKEKVLKDWERGESFCTSEHVDYALIISNHKEKYAQRIKALEALSLIPGGIGKEYGEGKKNNTPWQIEARALARKAMERNTFPTHEELERVGALVFSAKIGDLHPERKESLERRKERAGGWTQLEKEERGEEVSQKANQEVQKRREFNHSPIIPKEEAQIVKEIWHLIQSSEKRENERERRVNLGIIIEDMDNRILNGSEKIENNKAFKYEIIDKKEVLFNGRSENGIEKAVGRSIENGNERKKERKVKQEKEENRGFEISF